MRRVERCHLNVWPQLLQLLARSWWDYPISIAAKIQHRHFDLSKVVSDVYGQNITQARGKDLGSAPSLFVDKLGYLVGRCIITEQTSANPHLRQLAFEEPRPKERYRPARHDRPRTSHKCCNEHQPVQIRRPLCCNSNRYWARIRLGYYRERLIR